MIVTEFAKYAHALKYKDLPPPVVAKAKTCILDLLGVSVGSYGHANGKVAAKTAAKTGARGRARVWMTGEKLRAQDAVLANSVASHCILQDDWLQVSHSHIGAAVVPTVLAMAEENQRNGKDVIAATVAAGTARFAVPVRLSGFTRSFT